MEEEVSDQFNKVMSQLLQAISQNHSKTNKLSANLREPSWATKELILLLRGVFKYGENEWRDILDDSDFNPARSANSLALMWQQIKYVMNKDLKRSIEKHPDLLFSKSDWIIATIQELEKTQPMPNEEPISALQEQTFLNPHLVPVSQAQSPVQTESKPEEPFIPTFQMTRAESAPPQKSSEKIDIDMKKFAPHFIDPKNNVNKEQDFIKSMQEIYHDQYNHRLNDPLSLMHERILKLQNQPKTGLPMLPPQNQIIPVDANRKISDDIPILEQRVPKYNQVLNNKTQIRPVNLSQDSCVNINVDKEQPKKQEAQSLKQILRRKRHHKLQEEQKQTTPPIIRPQTQRFVAPSGVNQIESGY